MASKFRSQINRIEVANLRTQKPKFNITFFFGIVDQRGDIELDFQLLMEKLGFHDLKNHFAEYYALYPDSYGIPEHIDFLPFMDTLKSKGIYDPSYDDFRQYEQTSAHYEEIIKD